MMPIRGASLGRLVEELESGIGGQWFRDEKLGRALDEAPDM